MCERCAELAAMIEQTRDGRSVVELSFPYGTPRLIGRDGPDSCHWTPGDDDE